MHVGGKRVPLGESGRGEIVDGCIRHEPCRAY